MPNQNVNKVIYGGRVLTPDTNRSDRRYRQ